MIWFSFLCFIFPTRACQSWNCLFCIGNSQLCLYDSHSKSDWLFNTQSRVLQADWLMLENDEKEALTIYMPYRFGLDLVCKCLQRLHVCDN